MSVGLRFFAKSLVWIVLSIAAGGALPAVGQINKSTQLMKDLCRKQIVLLGESPTHSFANTLTYKTALVHDLIEQCHFTTLLFESGFYDFIHIERALRAGTKVSDAMVSAAIGGLWSNEEVQAMVPELTKRVNAGTLRLGGLDDQLGAGSYASQAMSADLVEPLQGAEKTRCFAIFQKHLLWQYTDVAPYSEADKDKIGSCLIAVKAALAAMPERDRQHDESVAIVESLQRNLARDFTEKDPSDHVQATQWMNARDRSMYVNFTWLRQHLPADAKIMIWTATVHAAKELHTVPGMEARHPLGSYLHAEFTAMTYSLGVTAYEGSYGFRGQQKQLSVAPAGSLEAEALTPGETTAYLATKQLRTLGAVPARLLGTGFVTAQWAAVFDGVVVIREEHAPAWLKR